VSLDGEDTTAEQHMWRRKLIITFVNLAYPSEFESSLVFIPVNIKYIHNTSQPRAFALHQLYQTLKVTVCSTLLLCESQQFAKVSVGYRVLTGSEAFVHYRQRHFLNLHVVRIQNFIIITSWIRRIYCSGL
jgi:hypothetical protein